MTAQFRATPSLAALALVLILPAAALAQTEAAVPAAAAGAKVFTPADFTAYGPRTALDMVVRVPGFSIQSDNDGARGFGQARGNVLIDGQRMSGKSNGAEDALGRIPASSVVRLELVEGASLGIAGLSGQVVNVITNKQAAGIKGSWRWRTRIREDLPPAYDGLQATLSGSRDALSWSLEAESSPERGANGGPRIITDGSGALIESRKEDFNFIADRVALSGSLAYKPANGLVANLNAEAAIWESSVRDAARTLTAAGQPGVRLFKSSEDEWNGEIGGDVEFDLGPGRLKAIGLARMEDSVFQDRFLTTRLDGTNRFDNVYLPSILEGEYIVRGEYSLKPADGIDWQFSAEGAFNFLESDAQLFNSSGGAPLQPVNLALSNSRVEEQRGELALTHGRALTKDLTAKISLGAEYSEIAQTGDAEQVRTFTRPKGYGELSWKQSETLTLALRVEREVGQLDFGDFISSVNLGSNNQNTGNPDIVPQQLWKLRLSAEKNLGKWGALTVRAAALDIEDRVDQVPIGNGEGPGNIASAFAVYAEAKATLKLAPLGWQGAELTLHGESYDTELKDPLTGETRRFNYELVSFTEINFRHDVPGTDWAWGANFEQFRGAAYYNIDERGHETANPGFMNAFIEHKNIFGLNGEIRIGNLLNQRDKFRREIYSPDRRGSVVRIEDRDTRFGPVLVLTLKGDF